MTDIDKEIERLENIVKKHNENIKDFRSIEKEIGRLEILKLWKADRERIIKIIDKWFKAIGDTRGQIFKFTVTVLYRIKEEIEVMK